MGLIIIWHKNQPISSYLSDLLTLIFIYSTIQYELNDNVTILNELNSKK